jgi:hypothetical protein
MAGAGLEVKIDGGYEKIIKALRKASSPAPRRIARAGGEALRNVSREAFRKKADPATGAKWDELKYPESKQKNRGRMVSFSPNVRFTYRLHGPDRFPRITGFLLLLPASRMDCLRAFRLEKSAEIFQSNTFLKGD